MNFEVGDRVKVKDKVPCKDCATKACKGLKGIITAIHDHSIFPIAIKFDNPNYIDNCTLKVDWIDRINTKELL
jgi:hypothetical protein